MEAGAAILSAQAIEADHGPEVLGARRWHVGVCRIPVQRDAAADARVISAGLVARPALMPRSVYQRVTHRFGRPVTEVMARPTPSMTCSSSTMRKREDPPAPFAGR